MAKQTPVPQEGSDLTSTPTTKQGGFSRRSLVRASIVTGAVVGPMGAMAAITSAHRATTAAISAPSNKSVVEFPRMGSVASVFVDIQSDENAHVKFLQDALKANARPKPTFKGLQQTDVHSFLELSRVLENTGVGAYLLGAGAITDKTILGAAASILTIEARHAGYLDVLTNKPIAINGAFDKPIAQADIVAAAGQFVASLNGGSDPGAPLKSDTDILNFALLLEFLEAEFYNLNVPKFYGTAGQG